MWGGKNNVKSMCIILTFFENAAAEAVVAMPPTPTPQPPPVDICENLAQRQP